MLLSIAKPDDSFTGVRSTRKTTNSDKFDSFVDPAMIDRAHNLLMDFVVKVPSMSGKTMETYNIHQLTHLAQTTWYLGPLHVNSMFIFESLRH